MKLLRRFLVIQAFMLWQGGFVFYAAVVVPIGTDLSSVRDQGFVTQQVTNWINYFGVVWCLIYLWELLASEPSHWRKMFWQCNVVFLIFLFALHYLLDRSIDIEAWKIPDPDRFRRLHIMYLIVSTIQWFISLLSVFFTLWSWNWFDSYPDYNNFDSVPCENIVTASISKRKPHDHDPETL